MDFVDYIANMNSSSFQVHPKWEKYYSAREAYGPLLSAHFNTGIPNDPLYPLNATYWHLVSEAMKIDADALEMYARRATRYVHQGGIRRNIIRSKLAREKWLDGLKNPPPPYKLKPGLHIDDVKETKEGTPGDFDITDEEDEDIVRMVHHSHLDAGTIMKEIVYAFVEHSNPNSNHIQNSRIKQECFNDMRKILNRN